MIVWRLVKTIALLLFAALSSLLGTLLALFFVPLAKKRTRPFQLAARWWSRLLIWLSGIRVEVSGLENIPKGQGVIIAANHQGAADIILVLALLPLYFRFAAKKELFSLPIFGWYLRMAGYFPIDRKLVLSAYKIVDQISSLISEGESVLIFPEGTRSANGELGSFKRGSLLAAVKSGAPIVPVAISGSYNLMPKGTWLIQSAPIKLTVCPPVKIAEGEDYEAAVAAVRQAIASKL